MRIDPGMSLGAACATRTPPAVYARPGDVLGPVWEQHSHTRNSRDLDDLPDGFAVQSWQRTDHSRRMVRFCDARCTPSGPPCRARLDLVN